jgi:tetratricopeptide (TPR) repeat protein
VENLPEGDLSHKNFWVLSRDTGARGQDPLKYYNDALLLQKQFFDTLIRDPDGLNNRSVFYTAQSYMDSSHWEDATKWYSLYTKLKNTWIEEEFESYLRLGQCFIKMNYPKEDVVRMFEKAISIFSDRSEPYYMLGKYYNTIREFDEAYIMLRLAKSMSYQEACKKYRLFVQKGCYGNYVNDELSVACYWSNKPEEGIKYIEEAYQDPEMAFLKPHYEANRGHFKDKYNM